MDNIRQELEIRNSSDSNIVKRLLVQLQDKLIASQELADDKLQSVQHILDVIENKQRQLDTDAKKLGWCSIMFDCRCKLQSVQHVCYIISELVKLNMR